MIYPTDYRDRMIKEEKSRQYKAMLDEQIRDNYLLNQQRNRKNNRIRTDPSEVYEPRSKIHSSTREIPHQSTFLPSINTSSIIDHGYRYGQGSGYQTRRYAPQLPSRKQSAGRHNDQDLDEHLDKCLEECDNLINGINKSFVQLNNQFRINQSRKKDRRSNVRNNSDFDLLNNPNYKNHNTIDSYPLTNLKGSELVGYGGDVGRNQMMNYNILKAKEKFQYFSPEKKSSSANREGYDNSFDKSQQRTKRKNPNDFSNSKSKNVTHGSHESHGSHKSQRSHDFDTINSSADQNEFINSKINLENQENSTKMYEKKKQQQTAKREKQDEAVLKEMKKKDDKIIEHLRRAKNRGNILFKKIEVFKKQRQEMQRATSSISDNDDDESPRRPEDNKKKSNNGQSQSKNKNHPNEGVKNQPQVNKSIQNEIHKQDIVLNNSPKKQDSKATQNKEKQQINHK